MNLLPRIIFHNRVNPFINSIPLYLEKLISARLHGNLSHSTCLTNKFLVHQVAIFANKHTFNHTLSIMQFIFQQTLEHFSNHSVSSIISSNDHFISCAITIWIVSTRDLEKLSGFFRGRINLCFVRATKLYVMFSANVNVPQASIVRFRT